MPFLQRAAMVVGVLGAPIMLGLAVVAFLVPASMFGWAYLVAGLAVVVGLILAPSSPRATLALVGVAIVGFGGALGLRALFASNSRIEVVVLQEEKSDWHGKLIDERDGAIPAAFAYYATGRLPRADGNRFVESLQDAYRRMEEDAGVYPTPAVQTYLNKQKPDRFESVVIHPSDRKAGEAWPKTAIVFLHGLAGNFTVYCWQLSRSAAAIGAVTVCPSTSPRGDWWEFHGLETLRGTIAEVKKRGVERIYLAGFSNGGVGAGTLINHVSADVRGLILISGAPRDASLPARMPALVIHGKDDTLAEVDVARAYARRPGAKGDFVELEGGHFIFVERHEEVTAKIADWLRKREGRPATARKK
jgi:pimeloyl-ACP methyl ester carboxylesterase